MEKNAEYSGIKCDTPGCGYRDDSVTSEEYPNWVDKPCPTCGANLLSKEDFEHTEFMVNLLNGMSFPELDPELEVKILAEMEANGLTPEMMVNSLKGIPHDEIEKMFKLFNDGANNDIHL